jgi:integrase
MKRLPGAPYLVKDACDDYLDEHVDRHRGAKGAKEIRRMFKMMLGSIETLPVESIQRNQAFALIESHRNIPSQAKRLRTELGAAWDHAVDAGRVSDNTPNWWRQIMRGKLKSVGKRIEGKPIGTAKRVLSESELGELINWLPNFSQTIDDVLTLYLWTGTRGAEIVAMEGAEVGDEEDGLWWTIPKAKTKNINNPAAFDLRVPLIGRAETVVRRRLARYGKGYLFPRRQGDGHIEQKIIQTGVFYHMPYSKAHPESARPRLTVTKWAPHDLRRTVRTMLASMDCPRDVAESILGHMLEGVEGTYNLYRYDRQRREWLTSISTKLETLATTRKT